MYDYDELLDKSPARARFDYLFQQFPTSIQEHIVQLYSGFFNYFEDVGEEQFEILNHKLETALTLQHKFLLDMYGEILKP